MWCSCIGKRSDSSRLWRQGVVKGTVLLTTFATRMLSSIFGIAIIALPAGIITAGFMERLNDPKEQAQDDSEQIDETVKEKTE